MPGSNVTGSTWIRSIRESGVNCTRPIQLTGSVMALMATERTAPQIASRKSKRGSLRRPPTGKDRLMSPRRSFINVVIRPSGKPIRAWASSWLAARTSCRRLSRTSVRAESVSPSMRHCSFVVSRPSRVCHPTWWQQVGIGAGDRELPELAVQIELAAGRRRLRRYRAARARRRRRPARRAPPARGTRTPSRSRPPAASPAADPPRTAGEIARSTTRIPPSSAVSRPMLTANWLATGGGVRGRGRACRHPPPVRAGSVAAARPCRRARPGARVARAPPA